MSGVLVVRGAPTGMSASPGTALSRPGTTSDLLTAAARVRSGGQVIGIIGTPGSPLTRVCDEVVLLGHADERSVVQTRFATAALLLLRASLGEDLSGVPDDGRAALAMPLPEKLPEHVVFLGTGWTVGIAPEAALKCRKAAGAWTEAYPVREYQHGPISVAGPGSWVWSFDPLPDFVRDSVLGTGAHLVEPDLDPLAQLAAVHRLALALPHGPAGTLTVLPACPALSY